MPRSSDPAGAETSRPAPALPRAVSEPQQGSRYWAVFFAVSKDLEDPALDRAVAQLRSLGYPTPSRGEVDCLQGAREELRLPGLDPYYDVSLLFASREEARRFVAAYGKKVLGVAQVSAYCLD